MKKLFVLFFLALALQALAQKAKEVPYRTIRTLTADLNNDGKIDTIKLISSLKDWNSFNRIFVSLSGYGKKVFNAKDYWTVVDSDFLVSHKNAIHTKLLFLKKTDRHAVILLFGEFDAAGYRGEFSIINIENNSVKMPFDELNDEKGGLDIEAPIELTDLEHDGRLCFVYTTLHEYTTQVTLGKKTGLLGSYTPFLVYPVDDTCKMNKPLSKEYMEKHYAFAGYEYSEKIEVFYPDDHSKPSIWKKKIVK